MWSDEISHWGQSEEFPNSRIRMPMLPLAHLFGPASTSGNISEGLMCVKKVN